MHTISFQVTNEVFRKFSDLSKLVECSTYELLNNKMLELLEDLEDYRIAMIRKAENNPAISLETLEAELGLDD